MAYVIFALRVLIGGLLLAAGALKAHDGPNAFAAAIAAYRLLPPAGVGPLALFLPYFEMGLGAYLLLGLFVRIVAVVAAGQFLLFSAAVASLVVRGITADCGCFGAGYREPASWGRVGLDVLLAGATAFIALRAPGAFATETHLAHGLRERA